MVDRNYEDIMARIKGKRGQAVTPGKTRTGPRSKIVDAIMVLLLSRPMRAAEIAGLLGLETRYVSSYLSYWKTRGYVEYSAGFWMLTPLGEEYAQVVAERESDEKYDRLAALAQRIISNTQVKAAKNNKTKPVPAPGHGPSLPFIAGKKYRPNNKLQDRAEQAACLLSLVEHDLEDDEIDLLSAVLSHYTKWGSTYMYIDQLAELMHADYKWLLSVARKLQSKNLVYLYTDPKLGIRIGLSKNAKRLLAECSV